MDERVIDHALADALRKADPGPYPRRIPYAATVREFLPDPLTALRWATCTAAGTVVLGAAALVVKAMGFDHQAPASTGVTQLRTLPGVPVEVPDAVALPTVPDAAALPTVPGAAALPTVPDAAREMAKEAAREMAQEAAREVAREVVPVVGAEPAREPVALQIEHVAKVSVVPAVYEPKHARPDLDLNLLGMTVAVDVS